MKELHGNAMITAPKKKPKKKLKDVFFLRGKGKLVGNNRKKKRTGY